MENNTSTNAYGIPLGLTTNSHGFPVDTCSRCDGSGQYSYNQRDGSRCLKCSGFGYTIAKRAAEAWTAFQEAKEQASRVATTDIKVGDVINNPFDTRRFNTVTAIEVRGESTWFSVKNRQEFIVVNNATAVKVRLDNFDASPFLAMVKPARVSK